MLITSRPSWAISETEATPEDVYINRREWLRAAGFAGLGLRARQAVLVALRRRVAAIGGYPAYEIMHMCSIVILPLKKRQQHIQIFMNLDHQKIFGVMHKSW